MSFLARLKKKLSVILRSTHTVHAILIANRLAVKFHLLAQPVTLETVAFSWRHALPHPTALTAVIFFLLFNIALWLASEAVVVKICVAVPTSTDVGLGTARIDARQLANRIAGCINGLV